MWKLIDGYYWPYRINENAEVQKQVGPNDWLTLSSFVKKDKYAKNGRLHVRMRLANGRYKYTLVKDLMVDAFLGGCKPGMLVVFKNGISSDCTLGNIIYTTPEESGKQRHGGMCRPVEKIDAQGRVIERYSSISDAAKKNFMSNKAVQWRCSNKILEPFGLNGYSFRYETVKEKNTYDYGFHDQISRRARI